MSVLDRVGTAAHDLDGAGASEWLEADGLGGYAMGTVAGPRTRRYHALLCTAVRPPTGRMVLVNGLGETVVDANGEHALDAHHYPGVVHPDGHTRIARFSAEPWPTWDYALGQNHVTRELAATQGRARTVLRWRRGPEARGSAMTLIVRPFLSGRDAHDLHHENGTLDPRPTERPGHVELWPYRGAVPGVRLSHNGRFRAAPDWYRRFIYPREQERGLDFEEDLFCPGELIFDLASGPAWLILERADEPLTPAVEVDALFERERTRRVAVAGGGDDPVLANLRRAASAFVVEVPATRSTVIAGYPWFTDWGRDTFIAARGLGLAFGPRLERALLSTWAPSLSAGMIPNRFPDGAGAPEYNTVDASLWYALRCARHLRATAGTQLATDAAVEHEARTTLTQAVRRIIEGYLGGTRHGIHVDDDGLVHAADPGLQLTWMDAKVGDWVVTPRTGKPVEIQALWVAALEAAAPLFATEDAHFGSELVERAAWARSSFAARFWCEARGWLYDVIDGQLRDDTLRPNQLYALGLTHPLVDADRARRALAAVERELLVPVGLRSRARGPGYHGQMVGGPRERDAAYHEGTAWPYLLGIYADACQRVRGRAPPGVLTALIEHLEGAGLGQLAEVFDGDAPHAPRGCPAQAWSVTEALRLKLGALAED